ncbi:hypothetical protein EV421DRAFT_1928376 [Armillaria borealis]|uniref:Uncharacterized protein n=1 Tax=Armillaria borealis TaxID=47425 RepID=A0AA39MEV8_9AGAR|nr:hypothetical protein EV421DRAFT_1928376 [Armillaria borealis]
MEEARFIIESTSPPVCTSSTRSFPRLELIPRKAGLPFKLKFLLGFGGVSQDVTQERWVFGGTPTGVDTFDGRTDEYGSEYFGCREALGFLSGYLLAGEETSRFIANVFQHFGEHTPLSRIEPNLPPSITTGHSDSPSLLAAWRTASKVLDGIVQRRWTDAILQISSRLYPSTEDCQINASIVSTFGLEHVEKGRFLGEKKGF